MSTTSTDHKEKSFKANILFGITITLALILIFRLLYLQVIKYKTYAERAEYSTSKIEIKAAPRGNIFDRNGKIIATNKQSISVVAYPYKLKTVNERLRTYNILSKILKSNPEKLKESLLKLPENAPLPVRIQSDISVEEASLIVENTHLIPGIDIQQEPIRFYPHGNLAAHVIGYISQIDEKEIERRPDRKLGDLVGKDGVEKLYDDLLRGKDGRKVVAVNRYGKPVDPLGGNIVDIKPTSGKNIHLTIDLELQKTVERALEDSMAMSTAIAVNPNNGEVLALASYPSFDPNIFTKPIPLTTWNEIIENMAFLNRAVLGYVPGSIWKPITLIAGLDAMVVKPGELLRVGEAVYLGSTRFGDWTSEGGIFSLEKSLAWSRDTAFYQIGQRLSASQIREWGVRLGGGRKTGLELFGEEKGIVPDEEWKEKNIGEPWYPGNTLHYSIGQSFLLISPAQAVRIYSSIANGKQVPGLHVIKRIGKIIKVSEPPEKYNLNPKYLKIVHDGLEQCVDSGTGQASKLPGIKVAGKTGSAEVPGSSKTHGWFAAYAPANKPEIAIVAFAEKAGHGGSVAAPIAKKIFENYFGLDKKSPEELLLQDDQTVQQTFQAPKKKRRWLLFR